MDSEAHYVYAYFCRVMVYLLMAVLLNRSMLFAEKQKLWYELKRTEHDVNIFVLSSLHDHRKRSASRLGMFDYKGKWPLTCTKHACTASTAFKYYS